MPTQRPGSGDAGGRLNGTKGALAMKHGFGVVAACAATLALAACSSGSTGLQAQSASELHERVASVRAAALAGDADAARTVLSSFRADVQRLIDSGSLDRAAGLALLAHAESIAGGIEAEVTPPPTSTPEPSPTPTYTVLPGPEISDERREEAVAQFSELLRERLTERLKAAMLEQAEREAAAQAEERAQEEALDKAREQAREDEDKERKHKKDKRDGDRHDR